MALRRVSKTLPLLVLLSFAACPDPEGDINGFVARTNGQRAPVTSTCSEAQGGAIHDISGSSLFFISTKLTGEDLFFRADITNFVASATGATFDASFQPLVTPLTPAGCPAAFTPTGNPIVVNGVKMDAGGNVSIDFGEQIVSACAGKLGQQIDATIKLTGTAAGPHRWCGCVNGTVKQPIPNAILSPPGDIFVGIVMTPFPAAADLNAQSTAGTLPVETTCNCSAAPAPTGCAP